MRENESLLVIAVADLDIPWEDKDFLGILQGNNNIRPRNL